MTTCVPNENLHRGNHSVGGSDIRLDLQDSFTALPQSAKYRVSTPERNPLTYKCTVYCILYTVYCLLSTVLKFIRSPYLCTVQYTVYSAVVYQVPITNTGVIIFLDSHCYQQPRIHVQQTLPSMQKSIVLKIALGDEPIARSQV